MNTRQAKKEMPRLLQQPRHFPEAKKDHYRDCTKPHHQPHTRRTNPNGNNTVPARTKHNAGTCNSLRASSRYASTGHQSTEAHSKSPSTSQPQLNHHPSQSHPLTKLRITNMTPYETTISDYLDAYADYQQEKADDTISPAEED